MRIRFLAAALVVVSLASQSALADRGLGRFDRDDPLFLVGTSDPAKDWPFVHPGPADAWAGRRDHTFGIAFALGEVGAGKGECTLSVSLVDTNPNPPHLAILVN